MDLKHLPKLANLIRYFSLTMTTKAGSGHPTSSLSAADLMTVLFSEFYRYDFENPNNPANDRLIFSKGHASPLYYALFTAAGVIKRSEIDNYRKFTSILEGHPTSRFPYAEASTGSLGQGLSVGVGLALNGKHIDKIPYKVYVLMGDGEMAEGSVWEAMEIASKYKLDNLVGIIDVNGLGQSDPTMLGANLEIYKKRVTSFGWNAVTIDGHNFKQIEEAYKKSQVNRGAPFMIIAGTLKGKGISFLEGKSGWHGKALSETDFNKAVEELGEVDLDLRIKVRPPAFKLKTPASLARFDESRRAGRQNSNINYKIGEEVATRKAYGNALARLGEVYPDIVVLDGDVKNSTYSEIFKEKYPDRFFEMYIAEQNMAGTAVGLSRVGKIPFASTFSAFWTRAYDQIRMAAISGANINFCGSHAGVSIGEDGPSQMGLEDLSMFKSVYGSTVLYPADAVATEKLVEQMVKRSGIVYMRTSRPATPVIYGNDEKFPVGGCKVHYAKNKKQKTKNKIIIVAAGVTLYESLKAQEELVKQGIETVVVDCYSVKPIDEKTLKHLAVSTFARGPLANGVTIITVEDHWFNGGLGDSVLNVFSGEQKVKVYKLAVSKMPHSGKPAELLDYEGISAKAIIAKVREVTS